MKNKPRNKIKKTVVNSIVSAIIGAIAGLVLSFFIENITLVINTIPIWAALVTIIFLFSCMVFLYYRIENHAEFREEEMEHMSNPLIKINADVISDFASSLVKKSSYIRVVGSAKQDILEDEYRLAASKRYLSNLESMLSKDRSFQYYRVIPKKCNSELLKHIEKCISNSTIHKKTSFQYIESDIPFDFYISYQIFDQSDILIIVDNPTSKDPNKDDNVLCFWTRDEETIEAFTKRFDSAWSRAMSSK